MTEDRVNSGFVEDFAVLLGGEEAWAEAVHAYAVRRELAGDVLREAEDAGFGRRIDEHARKRPVARHAADVEDRTGTALDHVLSEDLATQMRGKKVRLNDALEFFVGNVEVRRGGVDTSAVDERIDAAELVDGLVEQ